MKNICYMKLSKEEEATNRVGHAIRLFEYSDDENGNIIIFDKGTREAFLVKKENFKNNFVIIKENKEAS